MNSLDLRRIPALPALLTLLCTAASAPRANASELFWYDTNPSNRRVQFCDTWACTPADFATSLDATPGGDMAIDPVERMVYWAINPSKIQRKSLDGGAVEDIFALSGFMSGIAIDPDDRHVYVATPAIATRIWRYDIDDPSNPASFVLFSETGCQCSPQGLALDLDAGFLYWADPNNGKIARKALDLATPIDDVVTGIDQPASLLLDIANDRIYFSQANPNRVSYALLSSPATIVDLVTPFPDALFAGSLERDPSVGTLGELFLADSGNAEILYCDIDAGCSMPLTQLASGMMEPRGLAFFVPEPSRWLLLAAGLSCLVMLRGVSRRSSARAELGQ